MKNEDKKRVALIKMDVEGYEANVLKGAFEIIKSSLPIIFFECNKENVAEFFNSTLSSKYNFFEINDKTGEIKKIGKIKQSNNYLTHNRIAVPKNNTEFNNFL